eukprot:scaffold294958_cov30-Tisochrysis_lutea.AAC.4
MTATELEQAAVTECITVWRTLTAMKSPDDEPAYRYSRSSEKATDALPSGRQLELRRVAPLRVLLPRTPANAYDGPDAHARLLEPLVGAHDGAGVHVPYDHLGVRNHSHGD